MMREENELREEIQIMNQPNIQVVEEEKFNPMIEEEIKQEEII